MARFPHRWRDRTLRLYREVHHFGIVDTVKLRRGYRALHKEHPITSSAKTNEYLLAEAEIWRSIGDLDMAQMFEDFAAWPRIPD